MSDNQGEIIVISSRATDILMRPDGSVIGNSEGGPALFIENALQDAQVPFRVHEGEHLTVEIEVHEGGEFGRISSPTIRRHMGEIDISRWCVVSTLLDEWVLDGKLPDRLMVDIQGYVRDGSAFGRKQPWPLDDGITQQIFCLKGTEEEMKYMPKDLIEDQKRSRMLVVTRGENGVVIYANGEEYDIPAETVSGLPDTVGAGDTFFAYYAAALYAKKDPEAAGLYAVQKVATFLRAKV